MSILLSSQMTTLIAVAVSPATLLIRIMHAVPTHHFRRHLRAVGVGAFLVSLLAVVSLPANALTVMVLNAEWFWDSDKPHEGQVAKSFADFPPSSKQVELEAYAIALHIAHQDADIVALVEVENKQVVELVRGWLGSEWHTVWKKGADTYTGQDVAILTRLDVDSDSISNLRDIGKGTSIDGTVHARPSKALSVLLADDRRTYLVVALHLISKRGDNDSRREAQADAIRTYVTSAARKADAVILLGDLNDTPGSNTLKILQGDDGDEPRLVQSSNLHGADDEWTYDYRGNRQLLDHILVSRLLTGPGRFFTIDLGPVSDHKAAVGVYE